jgi:putative endonuclease
MRRSYYVYMLTNWGQTVLYTGMTNDLVRRLTEHRSGEIAGFTKRYHVDRLVYYEEFQYVLDAIEREKEIKGWRRSKKADLINDFNPEWQDLTRYILDE